MRLFGLKDNSITDGSPYIYCITDNIDNFKFLNQVITEEDIYYTDSKCPFITDFEHSWKPLKIKMHKEEIKEMIKEFNELLDKISKLTYLLSINHSADKETEDRYSQLDAMIDYSKALERRLNRLGIESINLRDPSWIFNE